MRHLFFMANLFVASGCTQLATSSATDASPRQPLEPSVAAEEVSRGQIDSSPRFEKSATFRVGTGDAKRLLRFSIHLFKQTREVGGVADPSRPSGPDNRRFETTEGVSVIVLDDESNPVLREKLPAPVQKLHVHLEQHLGIEEEGVLTRFGEPDFADALIRFAQQRYGLVVKKGLVD